MATMYLNNCVPELQIPMDCVQQEKPEGLDIPLPGKSCTLGAMRTSVSRPVGTNNEGIEALNEALGWPESVTVQYTLQGCCQETREIVKPLAH